MNTQIKRKLHGSVLLTVVFVMSILIVFLFGTLALALAANNRAHVNYSSAQTSITARSVAESAIKAIENNTPQGKAYAKAIGKLSKGQTAEVAVELSGDKASAYGTVDNVVISYAGTKKYYDVTKQEWLERDLLKFTATVNMSGVTSTSSVYVLKHYEEDDEGESTSGAGFVTTAGANLACQSSLFGGSYISLPTLADAKKYEYTDNGIMIDGSKLNFGDASSETNSLRFHYQNSGAVIEADLYVNNNMSINNLSGIIFPKEGTGITILGDLYFENNIKDYIEYVYKGKKDDLQFKEVPYIYVDGKIYGASGVKLGNNSTDEDKKFPLNTFCGSIDTQMGFDFTINSNVYCMNVGEISTFKGQNKDNKLYVWANSVATKSDLKGSSNEIGGEICSKGHVVLEDCKVKGDVRVEGDLTVNGKVTVEGNVVVKGNIINPENLKVTSGGSIYNNNVGGKSIEIPNAIGTYYIYTPEEKEIGDPPEMKWVDPAGNKLNDYNVFTDGNFNSDRYIEGDVVNDPKELTLYYTIRQPVDEFEIVADNDPNNIDYSCGFICSRDGSSVLFADDTDNQFYAHTEIESFVNESNFTLSVDYGTKKSEATFTHTYGSPQGYNTYLTDRGEKPEHVYPEYAERKVILGLENKENQIVRTMEDVITKVANPYKSADLPSGIKSTYEDLVKKGTADKVYCDSIDKIYTLNDNLVADDRNIDYVQNPVTNKKTITYKTTTDPVDNSHKCAYISKSCILDGVTFANGNGNKVVINPAGNILLIVIKGNVTVDSGVDIMIDDHNGGKVYFYVDKNSNFNLSGTNVITTSYMDAIATNNKFTYASTPLAGYAKLEDVNNYIPDVYLYGAEDSGFNVAKTAILTMNITSPNLAGSIKATDDAGIESFIYHDVDILDLTSALGKTTTGSKQFLIGCFNAKNITMDNTFNVVYVGKGDDEGTAEAKDDEFWYKPLYYHDF